MAVQTALQAPPKTLREVIARSQLTTEQIVAKVGCTRKSLSNWKRGIRPRDFYITRLGEVLGADLWPLYAVKPAEPSPLYELPAIRLTRSSTNNERFVSRTLADLDFAPPARHQRIDEAMKHYLTGQLTQLWDQFHTTAEQTGTESLELGVMSYNHLLEQFTQWPLTDAERTWLLQALADGAMLRGRIARDQLNHQHAIHLHKQALSLALESASGDHIAAATMRLAEALWEAGLAYDAIDYCKAGLDHARTANPRIRGELFGFAAEAYSSVSCFRESERLVNEAARLAVGAVQLPTAGGINFSETAAAEYLANEAQRRGNVHDALAHIQRARHLLTTEFPTSHNMRWEAHLLLDQARAHITASDMEAASHDIGQAANLAHHISSLVTLRKAQSIMQELARTQNAPRMMSQLSDELFQRLRNGQ